MTERREEPARALPLGGGLVFREAGGGRRGHLDVEGRDRVAEARERGVLPEPAPSTVGLPLGPSGRPGGRLGLTRRTVDLLALLHRSEAFQESEEPEPAHEPDGNAWLRTVTHPTTTEGDRR